jgi:hypothetical protein
MGVAGGVLTWHIMTLFVAEWYLIYLRVHHARYHLQQWHRFLPTVQHAESYLHATAAFDIFSTRAEIRCLWSSLLTRGSQITAPAEQRFSTGWTRYSATKTELWRSFPNSQFNHYHLFGSPARNVISESYFTLISLFLILMMTYKSILHSISTTNTWRPSAQRTDSLGTLGLDVHLL